MKILISVLIVLIMMLIILYLVSLHKVKKLSRDKDKFRLLYSTCTKWIENLVLQKSVSEYFLKSDNCHIAIYGMGTLGMLFYNSISDEKKVRVDYFIDTLADGVYTMENNVKLIGPDNVAALNQMDVIIVTPFTEYQSIKMQLREEGVTSAILSLQDVVNAVGEMANEKVC